MRNALFTVRKNTVYNVCRKSISKNIILSRKPWVTRNKIIPFDLRDRGVRNALRVMRFISCLLITRQKNKHCRAKRTGRFRKFGDVGPPFYTIEIRFAPIAILREKISTRNAFGDETVMVFFAHPLFFPGSSSAIDPFRRLTTAKTIALKANSGFGITDTPTVGKDKTQKLREKNWRIRKKPRQPFRALARPVFRRSNASGIPEDSTLAPFARNPISKTLLLSLRPPSLPRYLLLLCDRPISSRQSGRLVFSTKGRKKQDQRARAKRFVKMTVCNPRVYSRKSTFSMSNKPLFSPSRDRMNLVSFFLRRDIRV